MGELKERLTGAVREYHGEEWDNGGVKLMGNATGGSQSNLGLVEGARGELGILLGTNIRGVAHDKMAFGYA